MSRKFIYYGAGRSGVAFLNPAIDWSLRNNTEGYNGAYIRVRRVSDNEEIDVSGVNNELDVANMLAWGGGSDIRVVRIYNKGFLGAFTLFQVTASGQPFIVRNGDLVTVNGKVAIDFSGGNFILRTFEANPITSILDKNSVLSTVFESQANGGGTSIADIGGVIQEIRVGTTTQRIVIYSDTRSVNFNHSNYTPDGTGTALLFPTQQPTSTQRQLSYTRENNLVEAYAENQFIDSLSSSAQFSGGTQLWLGWQQAGPLYFNGKWQETLIDTDQTKRELIDTNQINYYGV